MADDDDLDRHARAVARRRTALVLLVAVVGLLLADIVVPDGQYRIDPITFGLVMTSVLLLLDIDVPWRRP